MEPHIPAHSQFINFMLIYGRNSKVGPRAPRRSAQLRPSPLRASFIPPIKPAPSFPLPLPPVRRRYPLPTDVQHATFRYFRFMYKILEANLGHSDLDTVMADQDALDTESEDGESDCDHSMNSDHAHLSGTDELIAGTHLDCPFCTKTHLSHRRSGRLAISRRLRFFRERRRRAILTRK